MKQKFSLNRLLHNDKLMILLSLILAFIIWGAVVYGVGNYEDREITGVPVSITLNDYATQTMNLKIVDGGQATATVRVNGPRSEIGKLTAQDITVTADTGNVIKEGTYVLQLRASSVADVSIVGIVGDDGTNSTVTITCDVWREQLFPVQVAMPNMTVSDVDKYQFGTPSVGGAAVTEGSVTVSGPKSDIDRIDRIEAYISDARVLSETTAFTALLKAYDSNDKTIDSISFVNAEDSKVDVTVPIMEYHKMELKPTLLNVPEGFKDKKDLVTITPAEVEFWSVPSGFDDYVASIESQLVVDFDKLTTNNLSREITLTAVEGVRLVNTSETIKLKVNVGYISSRTIVDLPLSKENIKVLNCPEGFSVNVEQNKLPKVSIYGPYYLISQLKAKDIVLTIDMNGKATVGKQVVQARLELKADSAWVYYEEEGLDVQIAVVGEEESKKKTDSDSKKES